LKFAENHLPMVNVADHPRLETIETDEAQPAENLFRWKELRKLLLISQAVLQGYHGALWSHQRWQQAGKSFVRRGFEPNENQVARTNLVGLARAPGLNAKIALWAADENAFAPHGIKIRAQKEMDFLACAGQFGAVKASDSSAADNGNLHGQQKRHPENSQSA
jgi:hypothetical protein